MKEGGRVKERRRVKEGEKGREISEREKGRTERRETEGERKREKGWELENEGEVHVRTCRWTGRGSGMEKG